MITTGWPHDYYGMAPCLLWVGTSGQDLHQRDNRLVEDMIVLVPRVRYSLEHVELAYLVRRLPSRLRM